MEKFNIFKELEEKELKNKTEIMSIKNKLENGIAITDKQVCGIFLSIIPNDEEEVVCAMKNIVQNCAEKLPVITEIFNKFFTIDYYLDKNSLYESYVIHVKTNNIPKKICKNIIKISNELDKHEKTEYKPNKQLLEDLGK